MHCAGLVSRTLICSSTKYGLQALVVISRISLFSAKARKLFALLYRELCSLHFTLPLPLSRVEVCAMQNVSATHETLKSMFRYAVTHSTSKLSIQCSMRPYYLFCSALILLKFVLPTLHNIVKVAICRQTKIFSWSACSGHSFQSTKYLALFFNYSVQAGICHHTEMEAKLVKLVVREC